MIIYICIHFRNYTRSGGLMATKIFVRERRKVETGEKKPRFRVVGVSGGDLKIYAEHFRKKELEQMAQEAGAAIVWLDAGKGRGDGGGRPGSATGE
jgi:hypothetical protein